MIYAFDPQNPGQYVLKMEGHSENICALSVGKLDTIISGSWDKTAKVWKDGKCIQTLQGHSYAVWGVLQLDNGMIATASADRTIILWNNGVQFKVLTGHTDVVRTIVNIPNLGFASCSNDGTIRIWDNSGSSLYELHGHTSFVYSITVLPTGELVSSGEDRSARVWSGKAEIQTITLPCVSVWSVSSLPNGDFVVGGSDAIVRVFTRTEERLATEDELHVFQSSLAAAKVPVNQVGDLDTKKLGGIEVLTVPGKKEGEVKMLRIGDKVSAYQWSSADTTWVEIGEVTDAVGSNRKQIYQGKEYDYVFDVDIQEGAPPLKLPFNSNQNPFEAAQEFIDKNELPQSYLDQIGNFIIANAQNVVLGSAPVSSGGDPWSRGESSSASTNDRKSPLIPQQEFAKLKTIKTAPVLQKIKQINQEFNNGELPLSDSELVILDKIITAIDTNGIKATIGETEWNILSKICYSWPVEKCFPGLDVLRVVVAESSIPVAQPEFLNFERFFDFKNTAEQLLQTNAMLICRVLANSFPHKLKTTELQQTCFNVLMLIGI